MDAREKPLAWLKGEVKTPPFSGSARLEPGVLTIMDFVGVRTMKTAKKKRLEKAGWKVGTAQDFLGHSPEEAKIVEMKLALGDSLRRHRIRRRWTQRDLAERLGSSQSRVAKLETGALGVTLDLLFRALFVAGASTEEIARELRSTKRSAA
jgi:DNA-binding XRE family transcriptional regulator